MKAQRLTALILLGCGLFQIVFGASVFIENSPTRGFAWFSLLVTLVTYAAVGILYVVRKHQGAVFVDERMRQEAYALVGLAYGITSIGIGLILSSVFYDVAANPGFLRGDVEAMMMIGWGIPLAMFALSEMNTGRGA